jgi:8-oxo-dGTP diphosphatase
MRHRATAIIFREGKLLLVRDKGKHRYSLPGGAMNKGEPSVSAAGRELSEELGLHVVEVKRLRDCDFKGGANQHHVCLVAVSGNPSIKEELADFTWWDMKASLPVFDHVTVIVERYGRSASARLPPKQ